MLICFGITINWTLALSTISGGLIAGLVGLLSAYISRYLDRRERHLIEHKENFKLIERAVKNLQNEIWPFHYGTEELRLRHPVLGISPESSKNGILGVQLLNPKELDKPAEVVTVDKELFKDLGNHFKDLALRLSEFDEFVRTDGIEISNLLKEVSEKIYSEFYSSKIQVLTWTFESGTRVWPTDLMGRIEEQGYTGVIFLLVIGEDEDSWRETRRRYQMFNLLNPMREIAYKVINDSGDKVQKILSLLNKLDKLVEVSTNLAEEQNRNLKLRGRCKYARF